MNEVCRQVRLSPEVYRWALMQRYHIARLDPSGRMPTVSEVMQIHLIASRDYIEADDRLGLTYDIEEQTITFYKNFFAKHGGRR